MGLHVYITWSSQVEVISEDLKINLREIQSITHLLESNKQKLEKWVGQSDKHVKNQLDSAIKQIIAGTSDLQQSLINLDSLIKEWEDNNNKL